MGHQATPSLLLYQIPKYHDGTQARASEDTQEEIQLRATRTQGVDLIGQLAAQAREPGEGGRLGEEQ